LHSSTALDEGRFPPGYNFANRYRILSLLGRGGMGEVYRANDLKLGQPVALKFLPESLAADPDRLARFHKEVRLARLVSHPNVCRVYDIGESGDGIFLSMEYIDGEDLRSLLRRIGRLPSDKAIEIARRLCAGLAAAHDKGILHRDLKPGNVMLDGQGQVLITDFGLADMAGQVEGAGIREGTPAYQAPEQRVGKEVSVRSDIYSLGVILHEIFTGRRPGELLEGTPAPPVRDLDPVVERVIQRCLDPNPQNRPPSAIAVARALPGGDPLAAALAAGDTPSPQMVAAAGDSEAISVRTAVIALAVVAAGVVAVALLGGKANLLQATPFDLPPAVLVQKAREVIRSFGYSERPVGQASGFLYDEDVRQYGESRKDAAEYRALLAKGSPAMIRFWYRQSPQYLEDPNNANIVTPTIPAPIQPGMVSVMLNPQGQLVELAAMPAQRQPAPLDHASSSFDWHALFIAAGLDMSRFTPAEPEWLPPSAFDARAAWSGAYPGTAIPLRIEAASWRGRPVAFRMIGPWAPLSPSSGPTGLPQPSAPQPNGQTLAIRLMLALGLGLVSVGCFLAWRNFQLGKSDLQGALRLAAFCFLLHLAVWPFATSWANDANEIGATFNELGRALLAGGLFWIYYVALEPYVRRRWPQSLIAWSRLLGGGFRDPVVGSNVLVGAAVGVAIAPYFLARNLLLHSYISPAGPLSLDTVSGAGLLVTEILSALERRIFIALGCLFFFFLLRVLFRRVWIAAAVFTLVMTLAGASSANSPVLSLALNVIPAVSIFVVTIRFGLLAMIASFVASDVMIHFPVTTDLSTWYASSTLLACALVLVLAGYAFHSALAGRALFRGGLLDEA
jgi:serine/threonine-protein kinase